MSGTSARARLPSRAGLLGARVRQPRGVPSAPAWTITALLGCAYLIAAPASADLAAASYRSDLFGRVGFTLWDNGWYGGHHLPAYSLLAPALGWLIGPRLLATASMVIATALFAALIDGRFPERACRLAAAWFALGAAIALLSCRVPFDLGLATGLGALLLSQRRRRMPALALALACALASPVAGGFLALAALTWWVSARPGSFALWLAGAALAPVALLALAFPEGGYQPFVASAFYPALAGVLLIALLIGPARAPNARLLRDGALLYSLALLGAYVLRTPVGGNVDRLGALAAGPLAACALAYPREASAAWRARALVLLAPALLYWQANAPAADFRSALSDPAVNASYYAPLLGELGRLGVGYGARPARIEVVPTVDHWEARFLAARIPIARGWERQLDSRRNALFYEGALGAARLHAWLADEAISLIALPDAPLDYSGKAEARLLRGGGLPFASEIWRSAHWRLFAVGGASPLAQPPALLTGLSSDSFTLAAPSAGTFLVRVRYTPYWKLSTGAGCVQRGAGDWTALAAPRAGAYRVVIGFSLARVFEHSARCG
ncbi:MAG TPA: hypothetical protein VNZ05_03850 [Solirubrobacteraceae bacterium]|nr:hypothetical protein [Solirubrobacteraceae bacterium]